jgi:DNA helicase-2/ATP-dependent DNA helicase PcrA
MRFAADLHLHSHYADAVSPAMSIEGIALEAQRKGVDLLATGDCLQGQWLQEVEAATCEAEPGFFALRPELEQALWQKLPAHLRRSLRFVLSTEVCCAPPPKKEIEGIHYLIYFSSFEQARSFRDGVKPHGDLSAGRPTLNLNSLELLERVLDHGEDCHLAPAHAFNPWFSALGTVGGGYSLDELFGDLTLHLLAVETGLTSTPPMCRRVSSLDRLALYSCSDAHSLDNIGRECTLLDIEPNYRALFSALRDGSTRHVVQTLKFPLHRTRYYLNWCGHCQEPFDARTCPICGRALVEGSRDRLKKIADRPAPEIPADSPPFQELLPLSYVIAELTRQGRKSENVKGLCRRLIDSIGHERYVLTEATKEEIAPLATPQLAHALIAQRTAATDDFARSPEAGTPRPRATQTDLALPL